MPRNLKTPTDKADLPSATDSHAPAERLVSATLASWRSHGHAAMTARQISQIAGVNPSQINYYFKSFEQLLCSTQVRALEQAQGWCDGKLVLIDDMPLPESADAEAFGHVLASLIDGWCSETPELAFAWNECQIMAVREAVYVPLALRWQDLWRDFWSTVCTRFGLTPAQGELTRGFFTGESFLHRIRWNAVFDRACLNETCVSWARLLLTGRAGPAPLRRAMLARLEALPPPLPPAGSAAEQIAQAAADLVGREGAGALTHRAAAQAAGVNLGAVTYHLPTSEALMRAAWEQIYLRLVTEHRQPREALTTPLRRADYMEESTRASLRNDRKVTNILAMEELLSAAARTPELAAPGSTIRYSRGQTTQLNFSRFVSPLGPLGRQEAALISTWYQGLGRDARLLPPVESAAMTRARLEPLFDALRVYD